MIKSIVVPKNHGQKYYDLHYLFFINLAKAVGITVEYKDFEHDYLEAQADGKRILIDYGDHTWLPENIDEYDIVFKFHYSKYTHVKTPHLYPLTPISFYDWDEYEHLQQEITYTVESNMVLNNQTPGAGAKERREKVQSMLEEEYGENFDKTITSKQEFWNKINNCLVSVCVPGARNDMLDRGQFQYWAFGACTISPRLDLRLPHWREPMPGLHYVECADDYSDLIEKIEWCRKHRAECKFIGAAAKKMFLYSCTPECIWTWINACLLNEEELWKNSVK